MNDQPRDNSLESLVNQADQQVKSDQARNASADLTVRRESPVKRVMAIGLLALAAAVLFVQAPRFTEPFQVPNRDTDPGVVEADLHFIASFVDLYRVASGTYPDNLEQVQFPKVVSEELTGTELSYRPAGEGYVLDWTLPQWHAVYDGATGEATVEPRAGK